MAMRQYVFLTIVLILLILTAGCSDTSTDVTTTACHEYPASPGQSPAGYPAEFR